MKLKLAVEGSIQILIMTESVTSKDVEIIKAGISKLLKNGKNRIILEVEGADTLPDEVIRDIAILDNVARELAGRIVIVSAHENLRKKLEAFAKPPLVLCYANRKSAMEVFAPPEPLDETKPKSPLPASAPVVSTVSPPSSAAGASSVPAASPGVPLPPKAPVVAPSVKPPPAAPVRQSPPVLKEEILANELGDLGKLRKELAEIRQENKVLHDQLLALVENRRQAFDASAYTDKIKALELEIEKLLLSPPVKSA